MECTRKYVSLICHRAAHIHPHVGAHTGGLLKSQEDSSFRRPFYTLKCCNVFDHQSSTFSGICLITDKLRTTHTEHATDDDALCRHSRERSRSQRILEMQTDMTVNLLSRRSGCTTHRESAPDDPLYTGEGETRQLLTELFSRTTGIMADGRKHMSTEGVCVCIYLCQLQHEISYLSCHACVRLRPSPDDAQTKQCCINQRHLQSLDSPSRREIWGSGLRSITPVHK